MTIIILAVLQLLNITVLAAQGILITVHCFSIVVPGPPLNVRVLENTVVLWQAPQVSNGNITGYEVRISTTSGQTITTRDITGSGVVYYVIRENDVTDNSIRMAQIEVSNINQE